MDKTEFESSFSRFLEYTRNTYSSNLPTWYRDYSRTSLSRNITINTWNDLVDLIKKTASDINTITDFLEDVKEFVSTITVGGSGGGGGIDVETDPTVPEWAKKPTKPTYTAEEVGAGSAVQMPTYNESDGTLTFETLDGKKGNPIPLGRDLELPTWNTSLESYPDGNVPPTTEAIVDYVTSMLASGGSGGSCSCYSVPIQAFEYYNYSAYEPLYNKFNFTQVSENVLKAYIHITPAQSVQCGGYPEMVIYSDNPFIDADVSSIYYNFDDVGDVDSEELEIFVTRNSPLHLSVKYYGYMTPPHNWFIEITAKTDTREIWVVGQAMDEAY